MIRHALALVFAALTLAFPRAASASQGSACLPTTGVYGGLQAAQYINAGLAAILSSNSGPSAPANDCSGAPVVGQKWLDTSGTPYTLKIWDGTGWRVTGYLDPIAGQWRLPDPTGQLRAVDGTLAAPGIAFGPETGTGLRRAGAGDVRLTVQGVDVAKFSAGGVDVLAGQFNFLPPGTVLDYSGDALPAGFLWPDGGCESSSTYPALSALYGTRYGTCPAGQFRKPDLRGRAVAGRDNMGGAAANRLTAASLSPDGVTLGASGGAQTQTLAIANLPAHGHGAGTLTLNSLGGTFSGNIASSAFASGSLNVTGSATVSGNYTAPAFGSLALDPGATSYTVATATNSPSLTLTGTIAGTTSGTMSVSGAVSGTTTLNSGAVGGGTAQTGSGSAFAIVQPTMVLNKILKF